MTKKTKEKLKRMADLILKYWPLMGILGVIVGFSYKFTFGIVNDINGQLKDIKLIATTNQQMSLRNTIWNDNIPTEDRASACDLYLSLGYNSYTKKYCEQVVLKDIGGQNEKGME